MSTASIAFFLFRILAAVAGLWLIGRVTFTDYAYRSWRVLLFFALAFIAFVLSIFLRLPVLWGGTADAIAAQTCDMLFALGLVGILWENMLADRQRRKDYQKLVDQWRLASSLAEKRAKERELLAKMTRELTASLNLRDVLQAVVNRALDLGDADAVTVFVRNRDTGELTNYRVSASATGRLAELPPPRPQGLTQTVARTGEPAFVADAPHHPLYGDQSRSDLGAIASLPLRIEGEVVGVMNVGYSVPHVFDDEEIRLLNSLADVAALAVRNAALHERISQMAVTDELTGLPNRRRFLEMVRTEMQRARRYERPLTIVMLDLDHLKQINDEHGHAAGDAMLRGVAQSLRACVRDTDLPARLGGDEFAILLPETGREVALGITERVRTSVEAFKTVVDGATIRSTVSVGLVSRGPGDLQDLPTLIRLADDALYKSKMQGRNAVTVIESTQGARIDISAESG
jgi:diguanylate cyclase (GGDEF)-like protein